MSETTNVELVKGLYAAFDRGDLPGILQTLAPDIVWNWARVDGIPHSGLRHGPNEVAKFFEEIAAVEEPIDFPRVDFVAQGDRVVVLGKYRARVRATGRIWESDYAHIWTVRDGLIAGTTCSTTRRRRSPRITPTPTTAARSTCSTNGS